MLSDSLFFLTSSLDTSELESDVEPSKYSGIQSNNTFIKFNTRVRVGAAAFHGERPI